MKRESLLARLWRRVVDLFPGEPGPLLDNTEAAHAKASEEVAQQYSEAKKP